MRRTLHLRPSRARACATTGTALVDELRARGYVASGERPNVLCPCSSCGGKPPVPDTYFRITISRTAEQLAARRVEKKGAL